MFPKEIEECRVSIFAYGGLAERCLILAQLRNDRCVD